MGAGQKRERLTIQTATPVAIPVASLARFGDVVVVDTKRAHGFLDGDYVTLAGATPTTYNRKIKIALVSTTEFTFLITGNPATPATGSITATYTSDTQGGRREIWSDVAAVAAELVPVSARESLELAAIQSDVRFRFRIYARTDLRPTHRVLWAPRWPRSAPRRTLEINGILQDPENPVRELILECAEAPAR